MGDRLGQASLYSTKRFGARRYEEHEASPHSTGHDRRLRFDPGGEDVNVSTAASFHPAAGVVELTA